MTDTTFRSNSASSPMFQGLSGRRLHAAWTLLDRERQFDRLKACGQSMRQACAPTMSTLPRKRKHKGSGIW